MKAKKIIIPVVGTLLLTGTLAMVGFLSFTGMLAISPVTAIAGASFFFAVVIEGEGYKQFIFNGLKKLFTRDYIKRKTIERELDLLLIEEENLKASQFLRDYLAQKKYLARLRDFHAAKKTIHTAEKRLQRMQDYFSQVLYSDSAKPHAVLEKELLTIIPLKKRIDIRKEITRKSRLSRSLWILYSLAGVGCSFAGIYSINAGFTFTLMTTLVFIVTPTILLGGIVPIAALAGVGYTIMLYHNVSKMICNDTIQKWIKKIINYFHFKKSKENKFKYVLRIALVSVLTLAVVGLAVFATVATAGTWWTAAKEGARLIPFLVKFADWIRNITIPAMTIPNLLFNVRNSLSTLKKLGKYSVKQKIQHIIEDVKDTKRQENWVQFFNIFRIMIKLIELPVRFICVVAHFISSCVMGDRLDPIPSGITAGLNFANEALVDAHIFMEPNNADKKIASSEHDHQHGTLIDLFLKVILSPLYFCSALWSFSAGSWARKNAKFLPILKETFGFRDKLQSNDLSEPKISNLWKYQEILQRVDKKIAQYNEMNFLQNKKIAQDKQNVLIGLKNRIEQTAICDTPQELGKVIPQPLKEIIKDELKRPVKQVTGMQVLKAHRNHFFQSKNKISNSKKFIAKILQNPDYDSVTVAARSA